MKNGSTLPGMQPWSEPEIEEAILATARGVGCTPLPTLTATNGPAAYLLWIQADQLPPPSDDTGGSLLSLFGPVAHGFIPAYAGAAANMRDRAARHEKTLSDIIHLEPEDLGVTQIPTDSLGSALLIENRLIDRVDPCLNRPGLRGLGSRHQRRSRVEGQRPTAFDAVLPRVWARPADPIRRLRVIAELAEYVTQPDLGAGWYGTKA